MAGYSCELSLGDYNISCNMIVDAAARLSGDSYWLPNDYNIFQNSALPYSYHERRYWEIWI